MCDLLQVLKELDDDPAAMQAAAKALCVRRGHDPAEYVGYDDGTGHAVYRRRPRWMNVYDELQEAATTILCLVED